MIRYAISIFPKLHKTQIQKDFAYICNVMLVHYHLSYINSSRLSSTRSLIAIPAGVIHAARLTIDINLTCLHPTMTNVAQTNSLPTRCHIVPGVATRLDNLFIVAATARPTKLNASMTPDLTMA
jgi:hypothetical protein